MFDLIYNIGFIHQAIPNTPWILGVALPTQKHNNKNNNNAIICIWSHLHPYQAIPNTPFTLGVALPTQYDLARVVGGTEVTIDALEGDQ